MNNRQILSCGPVALWMICFPFLAAHGATNESPDSVGPDGSETPTRRISIADGTLCFEYKKYIAIQSAIPAQVGSEVKIFAHKKEATCEQPGGPPVFKSGRLDAGYFFGISGDYLFLDEGTAPGERGISVLSLPSGKALYGGSYNEPISIKGNTLTLWSTSPSRKASPALCNGYKQLANGGEYGVDVVEEVKVDINTKKSTKTGKFRCEGKE